MKRIVLVMDGPELINKNHRNHAFIEDFVHNPYLKETIIEFKEGEYKKIKYAMESMRLTVRKYFDPYVTCKVRDGKLFLKKK